MKICVMPDYNLTDPARLPECDFALMGFNALGAVDYESELSGRTEKFGDLAKVSRLSSCGVLCGCKTDSRGLKRKSVAVADRGKLLGITDMMYVIDGGDFKSGAGLGVYQLGGYKVGLCIENDLYFPENVRALSLCGCNLIAAFMENATDNIPTLLIRSYAYLYGVPVVMSAGKCAYFADITGAIATSNQKITAFVADPKNCYHVVTARRRGIAPAVSDDY